MLNELNGTILQTALGNLQDMYLIIPKADTKKNINKIIFTPQEQTLPRSSISSISPRSSISLRIG